MVSSLDLVCAFTPVLTLIVELLRFGRLLHRPPRQIGELRSCPPAALSAPRLDSVCACDVGVAKHTEEDEDCPNNRELYEDEDDEASTGWLFRLTLKVSTRLDLVERPPRPGPRHGGPLRAGGGP